MAHERTKSTSSGSKERPEKKASELNVESLFKDLDARASKFMAGAERWIGQGDELLAKAKTWIEEHPVVLAVATKYGRKVSFIPKSGEELKDAAREAQKRARRSTSRAYETIRENPMELAVVGLALGTIAWATIRAVRA